VELSELLNEKEWRLCRGPENASIDEQLAAFVYFVKTIGLLNILSVPVFFSSCVKRK
jgi:hypothetical protein